MGRREKTKAKKSNGVKLLIIILVLLLIVAGVLFALKTLKKGQVEQVNNGEVQQEEKKEQPKLKIVNQTLIIRKSTKLKICFMYRIFSKRRYPSKTKY